VERGEGIQLGAPRPVVALVEEEVEGALVGEGARGACRAPPRAPRATAG
jgi:hypothetical protein